MSHLPHSTHKGTVACPITSLPYRVDLLASFLFFSQLICLSWLKWFKSLFHFFEGSRNRERAQISLFRHILNPSVQNMAETWGLQISI